MLFFFFVMHQLDLFLNQFDPHILKAPNNCYIDSNTWLGYWNSYKYFQEIDSVIKDDFTFKQQEKVKIIKGESVSVHVRRWEKHVNYYGNLTKEYYKKAIDFMSYKLKQPTLYIFGQEEALIWAKSNINTKMPKIFISKFTNYSTENDFRLMINCKHNIIANSTYSWWGAWLNQNPGKIVVAPKKWLKDRTIDTSDLIPEEWVKI